MGEVRVVESSLVPPSENTPCRSLWLSQLDLMATRGHTPVVWFYHAGGVEDLSSVASRLKASLAKALVAFYPLAGRLVLSSTGTGSGEEGGRVEVSCRNQGALFVVAESDLSFDDLNMLVPSPELRRLFIPRIEPSSITCGIQVTFLKGGGVAIGHAMHHFVVDAISTFHFLQTWAAISSNNNSRSSTTTSAAPCHDRTLLRARSSPFVHPSALSVFYPMMDLCEPSGIVLGCEALVISKHQVSALKEQARRGGGGGGGGGRRSSTFSALSAHIWKCASATRPMPLDGITRLTFPANIRGKLRPRLPSSYFGNALIRVAVAGEVRDIISEDIGSVAGRINDTITRIDDEVARSAIDYFELAESSGSGSRPARGSFPTTELAVISWLGLRAYDTDFGWGKPLVAMRAESVRGGRVYLMDADADGSVRIIVCLEATILKEFCRMLYANFTAAVPLSSSL